MLNSSLRIYKINGFIITKELAKSFVSMGSTKDFPVFLDVLGIKWSDDGKNWREMSSIAADLLKIYDKLPTDNEVKKYKLDELAEGV